MILTGHLFQISSLAKGHPGARLPAAHPTLFRFGHCALMKFSRNDPFNPRLAAVASSYPRHAPSRGIGVEPKRSEDSPPRNNQHDGGQTDKREAFARTATSQQAISEEEALQREMAEKSKEFVEKASEVYTTAQTTTTSKRSF